MAGVWNLTTTPTGEKVKSVAIITTEPNDLVARIHDRMPAILLPDDEELWLTGKYNPMQLKTLLKPYPSELMQCMPASRASGHQKKVALEKTDTLTLF